MQYRIGKRDPITGLYEVIAPDGGVSLNGIKIFNAETQVGDVVQATQRSDGMMILDGVNGVNAIEREIGVKDFGGKPRGYLSSQVFNNEDEIVVPQYLIIRCAAFYDPWFIVSYNGISYNNVDLGLQTCDISFQGINGFRYGYGPSFDFSRLYPSSATVGTALKTGNLEPDVTVFGQLAYELRIDTKQWPGSTIEVRCTPTNYKERSPTGAFDREPIAPDRCELGVELRRDRIPNAEPLAWENITYSKEYDDFLNDYTIPPGTPVALKTAFYVKYDKRTGKVSVT
ncbi:MAG: hypothetical protein ACRCZS_02315 [Chroococcidiopsis sp.]